MLAVIPDGLVEFIVVYYRTESGTYDHRTVIENPDILAAGKQLKGEDEKQNEAYTTAKINRAR